MIGIYKITSPSGKIYIGQSKKIENRFNFYKNKNERVRYQPRLNNSFIFHGKESHIMEVIEECNGEQLNERERYWQDFYDACGVNGLNCVLTKTKDKPGFVHPDVKLKISSSKKAYVKTICNRCKFDLLKPKKVTKFKRKLNQIPKEKKKRFVSEKMLNMLRTINIGRSSKKKGLKSEKKYSKFPIRVENRRKCFFDNETGIYYESIDKCAYSLGVKRVTLWANLYRNKNKTQRIIECYL